MIDDTGVAVALAEITGTDEQHVDARDGGNLIDLVHCFAVFNLDDQERFFVGPLAVLLAADEAIPGGGLDAIHAAKSERSEAGVAYDVAGIGGAHAVRDHDASTADFVTAETGMAAFAADPYHRFHAGGAAGETGFVDLVVAEVLMLHVNPQAIKAEHADEFGNLAGTDRSEADGEDDFLVAEFLEDTILMKCGHAV